MKIIIKIGFLAVCLMAWRTIDEQNDAQQQGIETALATNVESDAESLKVLEEQKIIEQREMRSSTMHTDPAYADMSDLE